MPSSDRLTNTQESRIVALFDAGLQRAALSKPLTAESEPAYTARVLIPVVEAVRQRLALDGVTIAGDGTTRTVPTYLLGHRFYPDMSISFYGRRLAAYEVKFLRAGPRSNAISTAFGQCLLYQLDRYPRVRAVLLDRTGTRGDDLEHAMNLMKRSGDRIGLIHRVV